jgi:hypothetical protein
MTDAALTAAESRQADELDAFLTRLPPMPPETRLLLAIAFTAGWDAAATKPSPADVCAAEGHKWVAAPGSNFRACARCNEPGWLL